MNIICISELISLKKAKEIFMEIFELYGDSVSVFIEESDIEHWNKKGVFVVVRQLEGDFPLQFEVYPETGKSDGELAKQFSEKASVSVLYSDNQINPFAWFLWTGKKRMIAHVNANEIGNNNSFIIEKVVDDV